MSNLESQTLRILQILEKTIDELAKIARELKAESTKETNPAYKVNFSTVDNPHER